MNLYKLISSTVDDEKRFGRSRYARYNVLANTLSEAIEKVKPSLSNELKEYIDEAEIIAMIDVE